MPKINFKEEPLRIALNDMLQNLSLPSLAPTLRLKVFQIQSNQLRYGIGAQDILTLSKSEPNPLLKFPSRGQLLLVSAEKCPKDLLEPLFSASIALYVMSLKPCVEER